MATRVAGAKKLDANARAGDTVPLAQLPDGPADGVDPYRTDESTASVRKPPRRTLDDMRRLSELIKRTRAGSEPASPAAKPIGKARSR